MWTPKRILIMLGGLTLFLAGYAVYAHFLGGIDGLPVLPEMYWFVEGPLEGPKRTEDDGAETKWKMAFGSESIEAKREIKLDLRSKNILLAAKIFEIEGGRVKLSPFSAALFGKNKGDGAFPEINTIQCDVAWLTLDRPVSNMAELSNCKITRVELRSNSGIHITNNRRTPEKNDDVELFIPNGPLYYDERENLIWTDDFVRLLDIKTQPDPTKIDAKGMQIKLSEDSGPNRPRPAPSTTVKDDTVNGVEMLILKSEVTMHLYVDGSSGFLAGPPEAAKAKSAAPKGESPEKAHLVVTTSGPFHYDLKKELAWFDSPSGDAAVPLLSDPDVHVTREHKGGDHPKYDSLQCNHLELQFRKKTDVDPKAPRDSQSPDKEIVSALATRSKDKELALTMQTENLDAYGAELHYRSPTATIGPQTILKGSPGVPMHAVKDGHKIEARELHLIGADKNGNGQQAIAKGPGQIDLYDKSNPQNALPSHAVWRDNLTIVKEREGDKTLDFITLTGDASFVDEEHKYSLEGQRLHTWLEADTPAADAAKERAANAPSASRQKVRKIEAFEKVTLRSESLIINLTNHLAIPFKNQPVAGGQLPDVLPGSGKPPAPPAPATDPARTNRPQLSPPVPETKTLVQTPTKSRKPIELWANDVVAYMVTQGDKQELQELVTEGAVHVHQEGEESQDKKSKDKGVDIIGEMLNLHRYPGGDVLYVFGDSRNPAQLQLGELIIVGPKVTINQKDNSAEVEGTGAMTMPSDTTFEGGKAPKGKTRLIIHWNKGMIFNGKDAHFHGGVNAYQDSASLKCMDLDVTLDRVVSFKDGQKENQDAKVERLVCHRQVLVLDEKKDAAGKLQKFGRLVATQLTTDNQDGPINASGPGKLEHLAPGGADDPLQGPASRPKDQGASAPQVMKLTRVHFENRMYSTKSDNSRNAKFYDNVEVFHFPTEDPDAKMNPDNPPKDGFYMRCKTLSVLTKQIENKSSQMMLAQDNVFFRTQEFFGTATVVKYDESKELVIFEGPPGNPATLYHKRPGLQNPREIKGSKILYNRKTGEIELEGGKLIQGR